jgi:signal transduction histidine kinase
MGWLGRLFDARDTWVRMLLLDLSGIGYLVFNPELTPTPLQLLLAVPAFACALIFHHRPVLNLAGQAALLAVAFQVIDDPTINQVGTSWTLFELTMAAPRLAHVGWAAALVAAVYLSDSIGDPLTELPSAIFGLIVLVGLPLLVGMVIRTTRELGRQAADRAVERAAEEQRHREAESRAARAGERSAIARELHDVVAHHVASMVLRVGVARHVLPDLDPRVGEVFDDVHATGTAALTDLRRLVAVLRDPDAARDDAALTAIEPAALPAALSGAVENARRSGVLVDAEIADGVGALDAVRGAAVLRLTQEALTNVAKHAGPSAHARLRVSVVDGDVHWEVTDDGGTPGAGTGSPQGGGHGLTGMRERVSVLGGELSAGPRDGGWSVRTVLPSGAPTPARPGFSAPSGGPGAGSSTAGAAGPA